MDSVVVLEKIRKHRAKCAVEARASALIDRFEMAVYLSLRMLVRTRKGELPTNNWNELLKDTDRFIGRIQAILNS